MDDIFASAIKEIDQNQLSNDFGEFAVALKTMYDQFKKAGFTPNQSLTLVSNFMENSMKIAISKGGAKK